MGLGKFLKSFLGNSSTQPRHAAWDDPVDIAALTVPEIARGEKPVLFVAHDLGVGEGLGGWLLLDGPDVSGRKPVGIAKVDLLKRDPSLSEITDLPVGWQARRERLGKPWIREQS